MTILSNNIQRLRKLKKLTQTRLALAVHPKITKQTISNWEHKTKPTVPPMPHLYTLAVIFETTIDELWSNPNCMPGLTASLDKAALTKVFKLLASEKDLNYALENAPTSVRVYLFSLLYSLAEDSRITAKKLRETMHEAVKETSESKPGKS